MVPAALGAGAEPRCLGRGDGDGLTGGRVGALAGGADAAATRLYEGGVIVIDEGPLGVKGRVFRGLGGFGGGSLTAFRRGSVLQSSIRSRGADHSSPAAAAEPPLVGV